MSGGVGAALGEALDGGDDPLEPADQVSLFDDLDESETGALDAPSPLSAFLATTPKRRGRTKGARNRRTEAVVGWLLSQHRHPLSVMMEAYSMAPAELAKSIGLREEINDKGEPAGFAAATLLEVFKLQMRMAEAVAPYIAQRQPQAVLLDGKGALTVSFEGVSLPARGGVGQAGETIEGEALAVSLPFRSDDESRKDD